MKGTVAEDVPWFIDMLDVCEKCSFVNKYVYAYRQNVAGSVTNSGGKRSFRCLLNIFETETDKVTSRSFDEGAKEALYSFLAYELCILLTYPNISGDTLKKLKSYIWLIDYDTNPKVKVVKLFKQFLGLKLTLLLLKLYQKKRRCKR